MSVSAPENRTPPPGIAPSDRVILFDGVCRLCNGWSRFIIRYDKAHRFRLAHIQSEAGQAILRHFGLPTDRFDTMLYIEDGHLFEKSDAFLRIVVQLGWPWRTLGALGVVPQHLRDLLYDSIARNRYRLFGRYVSCKPPQPDHERRFLRP